MARRLRRWFLSAPVTATGGRLLGYFRRPPNLSRTAIGRPILNDKEMGHEKKLPEGSSLVSCVRPQPGCRSEICGTARASEKMVLGGLTPTAYARNGHVKPL